MVEQLTADARRNLARSLFPAFFERGISANAALMELRAQGLGYRRTDFLRDFRSGHARYATETLIKYVRMDSVPSDRVFLPVYHGLSDHYGYLIRYDFWDAGLGETRRGYAWYFTDFRGTKSEIVQRIAEHYENRGHYDAENLTISLEKGHINPYWEDF
ncbi:MAG: hypothetical protein ROW48_18305 [Bellilinea sp.]|jgi:hypothetical protein